MAGPQEAQATPWHAETRVRAIHRRSVRLLAAAQIVGGVGVGVASSLGPLLAESVTNSETYAGLARTATTLGAAAVGLPLALLAQRRGRRSALSTGWFAAAVGGLVLVAAAVSTSIPLLAGGMLLFGIGSATNQQSRFAAADLAAPHRRAQALSIVVWATTIGAVAGPNLAEIGASVASTVRLPPLSGAFLLSTACMTAASGLLWACLRPDPLLLARQRGSTDEPANLGIGPGAEPDETTTGARASLTGALLAVWRHLRGTPRAACAFVTIVVAHTVMVAVMTMSPVSLTRDGATLTIVGVTISAHLLGMYAFSPIVGWLAGKFGNLSIVLAGQVLFLVSALSAGLSRGSFALMTAGLLLLGLGWSFSLVAGSAMLTEATPTPVRPAAQGAADTAMNIVAAVGAGLAGPLMNVIGFSGLNVFAAALVLPVIVYGILLARRRRRANHRSAPQ